MQNNNAALILVDLQNDFCSGGALAVPHADDLIPIANQLMPHFKQVIATQDWHPKDHASFVSLWPEHCVQHSKGAAFHPDLDTTKITNIIQKGLDVAIDSYSAFYDNDHLNSTGLTDYLHQNNITDVYLMGVATEYCVKFSCLDAVADGFTVYLIQNGCAGINKTDIENALKEMQDKGVRLLHSNIL